MWQVRKEQDKYWPLPRCSRIVLKNLLPQNEKNVPESALLLAEGSPTLAHALVLAEGSPRHMHWCWPKAHPGTCIGAGQRLTQAHALEGRTYLPALPLVLGTLSGGVAERSPPTCLWISPPMRRGTEGREGLLMGSAPLGCSKPRECDTGESNFLNMAINDVLLGPAQNNSYWCLTHRQALPARLIQPAVEWSPKRRMTATLNHTP